MSMADQIASRVTGVRNHYAIEPENASYNCSSHSGAPRTGSCSSFVDARIRRLNQARQEVLRSLSHVRFAEACEEPLHSRARSDFTLLLAADSVRQREQPAVATGLVRRRGDYVAEIIFVLLADSPAIGKLREFHVQHWTLYRRGTP